ncbi:MAG: hypothetical protein IPM45_00460 [Acidimicrobiales bacterium]|nr:hypothetical protein [Acidimicrobiales bacterium]
MIADDALGALEGQVQEALRSGDTGALRVVGYGEISVVLGWPADAPVLACKRLPPFADRETLARYEALVHWYVAGLERAGVRVVPTELRVAPGSEPPVAYLVQPALPAPSFVPATLRSTDPAAGHPAVEAVVDAVARAVHPGFGLDGQLSNWVWHQGQLGYVDVSTPLARDAAGGSLLDTGLFVASLPWVLRSPVRRFVVPSIVGRYHDARTVLLDVSANLLKERLDGWLPVLLDEVNRRVDPPVDPDEVRRDYASDARLWDALQRVRRADRWWQRSVRRRPYPFLLPGPIDR